MHYLLLLAKRSHLWLSLTLGLLVFVTASQNSYAEPLSLESAWALAEKNNPEIQRVNSGLEAIKGEISDANASLFNNPTLNVEGGSRKLYDPANSDSRRTEWRTGISQTFELGGQQGLRQQAAEARLSALQQEMAETRLRIRAETEERFIQVLALQQRIETEQHTLELIERNTSLAGRRVAAGEDSKLDGNLAIIEAERARNQISVLQEQLIRARAALATSLQLTEHTLPVVTGVLQPATTGYRLNDLLASIANHPGIRALSWRQEAARNTLNFERAMQTPDLTVSLSYGRDAVVGGQDGVTTIGLSLPLPLFRKNATGIGRASTELAQIEIDRNALTNNTITTVTAAWQRRLSLQDRLQRLTAEVYPRLEENLKLSQIAFKDGEIALPQLLLVQRQVIDAQRDLIDAQLELRLTQIELEYAAGWSSASSTQE
jgi:cobalt-zinc-cadmium efflux system outer membrane protein